MPGWRLRAREVIRETIAANPDLRGDLDAMRRKISDAYPFGERRYLPYKAWLDEVAKATNELAIRPEDRICAACGSRPRRPCRDLASAKPIPVFHEIRMGRPEDSGPLFTNVSNHDK